MYISDEVFDSHTGRQKDDWTDRKRTFHRTTTLHAKRHYRPSNFIELPHHITLQTKPTMLIAEEAVLTQTLALLTPSLIFGRIPKFSDKAV